MRAIHQNAGAVDRAHHRASIGGEADIIIVTAAADGIVAVIDQVHLPHAEIAIDLHHRDVLQQHLGAFEVERDAKLARRLCRLHVRHGFDQHEFVGVPAQPVPEPGDGLHHLVDRVHVHADIDRHEIETRSLVPPQHAHVDAGQQRQAGMGVPADGSGRHV